MDQPPTIVLDEFCHVLNAAVSMIAPTLLFSRTGGFSCDVETAVAELHQFLSEDGRHPPFFLVSPSLGAFTVVTYAHRYPEQVVGLLLLDPSHPRQGTSALALLSEHDLPPSPGLEQLKAFFSSSNAASKTGARELSRITTLGDLLVVVLAAGKRGGLLEVLPAPVQDALILDRQTMLSEYARLSTRGELLVVPGSGHGIAVDAPEAVCGTIREMLMRIRATPRSSG